MAYLEKLRWPDGNPVSPFDPDETVYKLSKNYLYKGSKTGKVFNVRYGTIFQHSRLPLLLWFTAISIFCSAKRGVSSYQMARHLNISQRSAYRMLMKIRSVLSPENDYLLKGIVEMDELYLGPKGSRKTLKKVKTPIFGMCDNKHAVLKVVTNITKKYLYPTVDRYICKNSTLFTDEYVLYSGMKYRGYHHYTCNHDKKQYVDPKTWANTNWIELVWRHLRAMVRNYNHIEPKNLQLYVDEFVFRYNNRKLKFERVFQKTVMFCT